MNLKNDILIQLKKEIDDLIKQMSLLKNHTQNLKLEENINFLIRDYQQLTGLSGQLTFYKKNISTLKKKYFEQFSNIEKNYSFNKKDETIIYQNNHNLKYIEITDIEKNISLRSEYFYNDKKHLSQIKNSPQITILDNEKEKNAIKYYSHFFKIASSLIENNNKNEEIQSLISKLFYLNKKLQENYLYSDACENSCLINFYPDGYLMLNEQKTIVNSNQLINDILGYSKEELIGKKLNEIYLKEKKDNLLRKTILEQLEKDGRTDNFIKKLVAKDNQIHTFEIECFQFSYNNKIWYWSWLRKLSDKRETTQKLLLYKKKYSLIVENIDEVVWLMDKDFQFSYISPSIKKLSGFTYKELINKTLNDFLVNIDTQKIKNFFLNKKNNPANISLEIITKNNLKKTTSSTIYNLTDNLNEIIGYIGVTKDISVQKKIEKQLFEAKEKVKEADNLKSAFIANMSHEIRTPMTSIIGFASLLSYDNLSKEKKDEFVEIIERNAQQLLSLLENIIDIAKIESGEMQVKRSECFINQILSDLKIHFEIIRDKKNLNEIQFILNKDKKEHDFIIYSDTQKFKQIITNLLDNALKYTEKGEITFGYKVNTQEKKVNFFVKDTGIGIPTDKQKMIFDKFGQIRETCRSATSGTGLGLSIAKKLTQILGGKMWLESNLGVGSQFFFSLPYITKSN